jgi:hypothetical protein
MLPLAAVYSTQAKHLVISHGTFSWALALLSKRLHTMHTMRNKEWPVAFNATDLHIKEYTVSGLDSLLVASRSMFMF